MRTSLLLGHIWIWQKIAGWQDTEAQITVTQRNGQSLSQSTAALNGHLSSGTRSLGPWSNLASD